MIIHQINQVSPLGVNMKRVVVFIVFTLLLPIASATESNDFSNSMNLESGIMISGYVTESDGDNPEDMYQIQVYPGDTIQILFTSDEADFCVYMGPNGTEELDCFWEGNYNAGNVELFKRESTEYYFFKIDCGSTALDCSPSTEYTLKVIIYPDEAGDSLNDATELLPEIRVEGWAALDESAEPIDFDYYQTPVIEGDIIRVIITSTDMTSYRLYDQYGVKISDGYELGNYDFTIDVDYTGDLFIELFCVQNYLEPCEYSLIAIGSTYEEVVKTDDVDSVDPLYRIIGAIISFLLIIVVFTKRKNKALSNNQSVQTSHFDSEIPRSKAKLEKIGIHDNLDEKNAPTVIQNITYNIQDSAISGDINTNVTPKDD